MPPPGTRSGFVTRCVTNLLKERGASRESSSLPPDRWDASPGQREREPGLPSVLPRFRSAPRSVRLRFPAFGERGRVFRPEGRVVG
jgi:hypothetical protein